MFGWARYNYEHFTKNLLQEDMEKAPRRGPKPGERAPDFEAHTLDGEIVRLSDYQGVKNVVLTFGSATCPMTAGSIAGIRKLREEFQGDEVEFLFVYVREAHPGERLPAHADCQEKQRAAELLRDEAEIEWPIIVDELNGKIHRKYTSLPNPTFLIDKSGRVAFRSLWSREGELRAAIEELLEIQREREAGHAVVHRGEDTRFPVSSSLLYSNRALKRGGRGAKRDFRQALGVRGSMALATSRASEPIMEDPKAALLIAAATVGVLAAGVIAGLALRRRLAQRGPYAPYPLAPGDTERTGTDYGVGI